MQKRYLPTFWAMLIDRGIDGFVVGGCSGGGGGLRLTLTLLLGGGFIGGIVIPV